MKSSALSSLALIATLSINLCAASPKRVFLQSGSVNELQAKILEAGPGGTVILRAGDHQEGGTVTVSHSVNIVGEPGALIVSGTLPDLLIPTTTTPCLHVLGARNVTISGLRFAPAGQLLGMPAADCAVLVENSTQVSVLDNHISGFRTGVLIQHGDHTVVRGNTVQTALVWTALPPILTSPYIGIFSLNGQYNRIVENHVSQSLFGIFANDLHGQILRNSAVGNYVGVILCHAQPLFVISGQQVGADNASTYWHVEGNDSSQNALVGYLVIDGANHNVLNNNAASANGWVDVHLVGNIDFFGVGFVFPASYDNLVTLGSHQDLTVIDCGEQNTVRGDATVLPCPY